MTVYTVYDVLFPGKRVSVVYGDDTEASNFKQAMLEWARENDSPEYPLAQALLDNEDSVIINVARTGFTRMQAVRVYRESRIAQWRALGYGIVVRVRKASQDNQQDS